MARRSLSGWLSVCLVLLPGSLAQNCFTPTTTISSQAQVSAIIACQNINSLVVSSTTDDKIDLSGIQQLDGDLTASDAASLTSLTSSTLEFIEGELRLSNLARLSTLFFPKLTSVEELILLSLPSLTEANFSFRAVENLIIADTALSTLPDVGLLATSSASSISIQNNKRLGKFSLPLGSVSQSLFLNDNARDAEFDFPNLRWVNNVSVSGLSGLEVPEIVAINNSIAIENTFLEQFVASRLIEIETGDLVIDANEELKTLGLPRLGSVGGSLKITNNPILRSLSLPSLKEVGGMVQLEGSFTSVNIPTLTSIRGGFNLTSTLPISCEPFIEAQKVGKIRGLFICQGRSIHPTPTGGLPNYTSPAGDNDSGGSVSFSISSSSFSRRGKIGVAVGIAAFVLVSATGAWIWKRWGKK